MTDQDFKRMTDSVRNFLDSCDLTARMSCMAKLYLEFPDVGTMHTVHRNIVNAMHHDMMIMGPSGQPWTYVDDHTIEIMHMAGVSVILSCKQRFAVQSGGSLAYSDIVFKKTKL